MAIEMDVRDLDCNIIDLPGDILQLNLQTRKSKKFQIEIPLEILLKSKIVQNYMGKILAERLILENLKFEAAIIRLREYPFEDIDEIKVF